MSEAARCVIRAFASPYGAVHVRYGSEVIQDEHHSGPTDPQFWKESLQQFLTESLTEVRSRAKLLQSKSGDARVAFLSAPIFDPSGPSIGALAVVVSLGKETDWTTRLAALEALCRLASFCAEFLGQSAGGPAASSSLASGVRGAERGIARAANCASAEEFAFAVTNELRNKLACEQVSLGLVNRRRVRILSISGLDQVNRRSPGVGSLRSAMEECLDADRLIVHPRTGDWSDAHVDGVYPLHRQWHSAAKGDAVASIPLRTDGTPVAILSLRSRTDRALTREKMEELVARVEPLVPALTLTRRASRGLMRHAWESAHGSVEALTAPGRTGRKIVAGVVVLAALEFFFGSINYDLTVPCVVTPAHVRHVHAPIEGALAAAYVVQGDRVRQGDLLCEFDHRDLDQQRTELSAQAEVYERERDRAMAAHAPAESQLALANQQLVTAKLDIVNARIERTAVRAPIDGVVVLGDLRKSVGGMLPQGEPLFQIAPADEWTVELEVPESAVGSLSVGLPGRFAGHANPQETMEFRISRVRPTAQLRGAQNVYVAEADIRAHGGIRPGMEGVAKVHVGRRPVWWVASHRITDYLRLHLWL
jgi:multidrug resistance efflux pump